jgi:hypothetical protein
MLLVFLKPIEVNRCLAKICGTECIQVGSGNIVDGVLECDRSIGEAKWHNEGFKKTTAGMKSSFPLLPLYYSYQVIGPPKVQFCEPLSPGQVHGSILHEGKWVSILDSSFIDSLVVNNQKY